MGREGNKLWSGQSACTPGMLQDAHVADPDLVVEGCFMIRCKVWTTVTTSRRV
jgi:hypothetical protein